MPLIECRDLTKIYENEGQRTRALNGASLDIEKGEFVALMGPSGSGKSTLMHILGLLDRPSGGVYRFAGKDVTRLASDELARLRNREIGFVFQSFNLLPRVSVYSNVELPLLYDFYGDGRENPTDQRVGSLFDPKRNERRVMAALTAVGMEHRRDYQPHQLSGGEMQRVAIARALVNDPAVIFADEPTGNLDSVSGLNVMRILQDLHRAGRTIVLVTHETATSEHAERIVLLKDGQIVGGGPVAKRRFAREAADTLK